MSTVHIPAEPELDARQLLLPCVLALALAAFFARLYFLQVVSADELRARAERGTVASVVKLAPRGAILDRAGRVVASTRGQIVLTARPLTVLRDPATLETVAGRVGISAERLRHRVQDNAQAGELPTTVHVGLDVETATWIAENGHRLPGWGVETQPVRHYPAGKELAHILGYVRQPREEDVARLRSEGIEPAPYVGIAGIERFYEGRLMGRVGAERMAVDARRRPVRALGSDVPVPGEDLVLSIDLELQRYAYRLLGGQPGSIVAVDPRNGEVLALASSPTFDANLFLRGIGREEYAALNADPLRPLFPRAVFAAYSPGSTFKVVTTLTAQRAGLFDDRRTAVCRGSYQVGNRRFRCMGRHGSVSFRRAMERSCNVYFADLAMRVGAARLLETASAVGLGSRVGIDLPGESAGILPTPEWWSRHRDRPFSHGDTVNLSVGQGELAATPLQMAMVAATLANRGRRMRPRLAKAWRTPGESPEPLPRMEVGRIDAPASFWSALDAALVAAVETGTASRGRIPGLRWAGKTGSAENRREGKTHSWIIGYAPAEDPRIAICVMVERAGHGGEVAAPIAGAFLRRYFFPDSDRPPRPETRVEALPSSSPNDVESLAPNPEDPLARP